MFFFFALYNHLPGIYVNCISLLITEYSLIRDSDLFASGLPEVLFGVLDCTPVCTGFVPVLNRFLTGFTGSIDCYHIVSLLGGWGSR